MQSYLLPNGLEVKHHSANETVPLYRDIFEDGIYLRHGITLPDRAVVIDAGANIGLFTLFVLTTCPTASVYSIEPAPRTFEILKANAAPYEKQVTLFHCGVGDVETEAMFTFLPKVTCGSGFYDQNDIRHRKDMVQSLILSDPEKRKKFEGELGQELLEYYVDQALKGETILIPIRPISSIIRQCALHNIDLLKIDVEGSEIKALRGIENDHWSFIKQFVLEVHDSRNNLPKVTAILEERGFNVIAVPEKSGDISGVTMAYATRP